MGSRWPGSAPVSPPERRSSFLSERARTPGGAQCARCTPAALRAKKEAAVWRERRRRSLPCIWSCCHSSRQQSHMAAGQKVTLEPPKLWSDRRDSSLQQCRRRSPNDPSPVQARLKARWRCPGGASSCGSSHRAIARTTGRGIPGRPTSSCSDSCCVGVGAPPVSNGELSTDSAPLNHLVAQV